MLHRFLRDAILTVLATMCAIGPYAPAMAAGAQAMSGATGCRVSFRLPTDGPLPRTYRVTLAIVSQSHPNLIVSEFVSGGVRTVTSENQGRFTEIWNGLDDNFMPVPPGTYGVKGIYMPAEKWQVDGRYHTVTPKFLSGLSTWLPKPDQYMAPEPFGGDPVGQPLGDVAVAPNGIANFYWEYLENGLNNATIDLNKPLGYEQFVRAYPSGGAAGGTSTCTDGQNVWSFSTDAGIKYVYRADGKAFGSDNTTRPAVYVPDGWVKSMACWHDNASGKTYVYIAQGGRILQSGRESTESTTDYADKITTHDGDGGAILASLPVHRPVAVAVKAGVLYVLHRDEGGEGCVMSSVGLRNGVPVGTVRQLFALPSWLNPSDITRDSHGRTYVCDPQKNHVYQFDTAGKLLLTYGKLDQQVSGSYDPNSFMAPVKLACWTDSAGNDRLLVMERDGPNRVTEWSADGKLIQPFQTLQTSANSGYAVDPDHPEDVYVYGFGGWLTRYKLNYETGEWTVAAVYPDVGTDPYAPGFDKPVFLRVGGRAYLACRRSLNVYRLDGNRWVLSAAIVTVGKNTPNVKYYTWHDAKNTGKIEPGTFEGNPLSMPGQLIRYHGENWSGDLSLLSLNWSGPDVWQLRPQSFDSYGNPVYGQWSKVLTDPFLAARAAGTTDALMGGNELDDKYSDWGEAEGSADEGYFVGSKGGKLFSANQSAQDKLTRYVPDGRGGYTLEWRTGREAISGIANEGEIYSSIYVCKPINGIVSMIDQSRCGVVLYTDDGLYVDTLFPDDRVSSPRVLGVYTLPGEFFAGMVYQNVENGKIYCGMGKFTPMVYQVSGWSSTYDPVHPITAIDASVTISGSQIATPPQIALNVRGGVGVSHVAEFDPATGGANLDGTMTGWDTVPPITFQAAPNESVEVRCEYDPTHVYLRWHVRLPGKVDAKPLQPVERIFTHDRVADTVSFYVQGDPNAKPGGSSNGRPGDARFVFGLFDDGGTTKPVALGMYATWQGQSRANPVTYSTPTGQVSFANVALVDGAKLSYVLDSDGDGYVLTVALPKSAIPGTLSLSGGTRTMVDFAATLGGHERFWWSNADGSASQETYDEPTEARLYPGAWAPAQFAGLDQGLAMKKWMICGPFGGSGAEHFFQDPPGAMKNQVVAFYRGKRYPPDISVDTSATYSGDIVSGYWGHAPVIWRSASVSDLDNRVTCGMGSEVWYGATWVYARQSTPVTLTLLGHRMTFLDWALNGKGFAQQYDALPVKSSVTLLAGWNQIEFRGLCIGYPPFSAGLTIYAPEQVLWTLRPSGSKPETATEQQRGSLNRP